MSHLGHTISYMQQTNHHCKCIVSCVLKRDRLDTLSYSCIHRVSCFIHCTWFVHTMFQWYCTIPFEYLMRNLFRSICKMAYMLPNGLQYYHHARYIIWILELHLLFLRLLLWYPQEVWELVLLQWLIFRFHPLALIEPRRASN